MADAGKRGPETSHICFRIFSSVVSPAHIHQQSNNKVNSLSDRQQKSIPSSTKYVTYRRKCTGKDQQGDLTYFNFKGIAITEQYLPSALNENAD